MTVGRGGWNRLRLARVILKAQCENVIFAQINYLCFKAGCDLIAVIQK